MLQICYIAFHLESGTLETEWFAKEDGAIWLRQNLASRNNTFGIDHVSSSYLPCLPPPPFILELFIPGEDLKLEQKYKDARFFVVQFKDLWPRYKIKRSCPSPWLYEGSTVRETHRQKWSLPRENAESLGAISCDCQCWGAAQSHVRAFWDSPFCLRTYCASVRRSLTFLFIVVWYR